MHCPTCQHQFGYLDALKIVNPFRHACPACKTRLTLGRQGVQYTVAAALGGALLAAGAIVLEQSGHCSQPESLLGFVAVFAVAVGLGEWFCWKRGVFAPVSLG
jgi:hypothetical protein